MQQILRNFLSSPHTRNSISQPRKMTSKAFVRTTRPSLYALVTLKQYALVILLRKPVVPHMRSSIGQGRFGAIIQLQPLCTVWDDDRAAAGERPHVRVSSRWGGVQQVLRKFSELLTGGAQYLSPDLSMPSKTFRVAQPNPTNTPIRYSSCPKISILARKVLSR